MAHGRARQTDSGWVGAGTDDDLDRRLAAEEETFDLRRPHVMTALGPVDPAALGVTQFGERLLERSAADLAGATADSFDAAVAELEDLYAVGVRGVVTLDRGGAASLPDLRRLAARSLVHLVLVGEGPPTDGFDSSVGAVRVRQLEDLGIVREAGWPPAMPLLIEAAAVSSPTAARTAILDAVEAPVTVLNAGTLSDLAREALLAAGATLAFDAYGSDEAGRPVADLVAELARQGRADRVVLGTGITSATQLRAHGGDPGWAGLAERFVLGLMERGVAAIDVRAMLVENPQRQLTMPGRPPRDDGVEHA